MCSKIIINCRSFVRSRSFVNQSLVSPINSFATWKKSFRMSSNERKNETSEPKVKLAEEEWKKKLTPEQYSVCREKGTESPFSGKYYHHSEEGIYTCVACNTPLFSSDTKYDSGSGWPSFHTAFGTKDGDETDANVLRQSDHSRGHKRTEVLCKQCHAHLGHVFDDGPKPTGERFCINSVSLDFKPRKE